MSLDPAYSYYDFQTIILQYYTEHGRSFPWRYTDNPYEILVSEFMLQQTQTERVVEKYNKWLTVFPSITTLAESSLAEVLSQWVGLGYNRRARFLYQCAKTIVELYGGIVPSDPAVLQTFPGIGSYTASAVSTFAYNKLNAFIETNIRAVFIFFFFRECEAVHDKDILPHVQASLYRENPRLWYYALMDYGVQLKKKIVNPNRKSIHYIKQSKFDGSVRQVRGAVIKNLASHTAKSYNALLSSVNADKALFDKALSDLLKEGFVAENEGCYCIENF